MNLPQETSLIYLASFFFLTICFIYQIEKVSDFDILEVETDKDHIHLMVQFSPKILVSAIVRNRNKFGETALHKTVKYSNIDVVKHLLKVWCKFY